MTLTQGSVQSTDAQSQSMQERVSPEEWQTRIDLAAAYRLVHHFHWDDLIFTHISARVPGPEHHFLINPFGLMFDEITASSLVKIDLNGNIIEPGAYFVNKAGFTIHSAVHSAREDAKCVMHLHSIAGTAVSTQEQGLLPIHQTAMLLNGQIAYHDYEGVAFNLDERPRLVSDLGNKSVMILRNHGTLTVGPSVASAFISMYFLERACAIQIAASAPGVKLIEPMGPVQKLVEQQAGMERAGAEKLVWPTLIRMLDRKDPSYKL
ncbi:MAG: class II aldolase/adducin family protein [Candidatus Obscuribacterales bacterium]|nr:class II aldolase/adducin family protein [Candidatus Obscuribacterales bacterium]